LGAQFLRCEVSFVYGRTVKEQAARIQYQYWFAALFELLDLICLSGQSAQLTALSATGLKFAMNIVTVGYEEFLCIYRGNHL
jgi:hypothetical protein